jgi:large subunit ribosomal protein L16
MLMPKKTKYRKVQRGRNRGKASCGNTLAFGDIGLQCLDNDFLTSRQIESARKVITRQVAKSGKMWIRIFPDKVRTARAAESRMGKGKGEPNDWVAVVKPGTIIFEMSGVEKDVAVETLIAAGHKLPVKVRIVSMQIR